MGGAVTVQYKKSLALEVGEWVWGVAKGAFNEKATISQILVDAAIGMIPLVGDATAARDLIAITIGLCDDPKKREDKWQWIAFVVLVFALIPVIGGVIKGMGRLLIKTISEASHLVGGTRAAHLLKAAQDMIAFLNRVGLGNAEKWLVNFKFAVYESRLVTKCKGFLDGLAKGLLAGAKRLGPFVPEWFVTRAKSLAEAMGTLRDKFVATKFAEAIKELDQHLREIQAYIRSGGETTSQAAAHAATAGEKAVTRTEELILLEGQAAKRSARGGLVQNSGRPTDLGTIYTPEPGFPDLTARPGKLRDGSVFYPQLTTYAGQIVNRELGPGEKIFRVFGPGGATHGVEIGTSKAAGAYLGSPAFWGLADVPSSAEKWRQGSAVLDEWNRNGFMVIGTILDGHSVPACTGLISEQVGSKLGSQYLSGGAKQAMITFPAEVASQLNDIGVEVMSTKTFSRVVELGGVRWEFRPTDWPDVNGIYGYLSTPGPGSVQTAKLGRQALADKKED